MRSRLLWLLLIGLGVALILLIVRHDEGTIAGLENQDFGALVTKTLLIIGEPLATTTADHPRGAMLRAYDKTNGQEVGAVYLPAPQSGTPMTYLRNGKQYIVVAVSGGNYSGEYLAFRLP